MATTSRLSLRYPTASDTADVPRDIGNLASDIDKAAIFAKGTFASRPTSTVGSPGIDGRYYFATDTSRLYLDTGTSWVEVASGTDSVTNAMIATDAVDSDEIKASAVGTSELASGAVTQAKTSGLPYGILGRHALTTNFTTSATHTTAQDEGLSVSVTYGASRVLRVSLTVSPGASGGSQGVVYRVLRGSTQIYGWTNSRALSTVFGDNMTYTYVFNGPSTGATETFKVQLNALTANTAVNSYGNVNEPRVLTVEDLGPQ